MKKPKNKRKTFLKGFAPSPAFTLAEGGHSPLLCGDEGVAEGYFCVETRGHKVLHASKNMSFHIIKKGFTLAEVLITLGVIGVVAAVTMPTLIQNYKKHVVETRLAQFYTTMNQAIQMSETVNGDKKDWDTLGSGFETDEEGNPDYTKPVAMAWFDKYLKPYLKYARVESYNLLNSTGQVHLYFNDGSVLLFSAKGWSFFPDAKKLKIIIDENGLKNFSKDNSGTDYFSFLFSPNNSTTAGKYHYNKGIEPYKAGWDGTIDGEKGLKTSQSFGCKEELPPNGRAYCTALIMLNGWKIPKDYPLKF